MFIEPYMLSSASSSFAVVNAFLMSSGFGFLDFLLKTYKEIFLFFLLIDCFGVTTGTSKLLLLLCIKVISRLPFLVIFAYRFSICFDLSYYACPSIYFNLSSSCSRLYYSAKLPNLTHSSSLSLKEFQIYD